MTASKGSQRTADQTQPRFEHDLHALASNFIWEAHRREM